MNRYQVETDKGCKTVVAETRKEAISKVAALGLTVLRARREETYTPTAADYLTQCHGCKKEISIIDTHSANGKAMFSGKIITVVDHYCDTCWAARQQQIINSLEVTK